ncbi:hypothetical protein ACM41_12830 [Bradyrhizobium sp. CCBAU 21362]|nr:hypothetical protein [Bradyrhizobium sp. CCBAU 21362]
MLAKERVFELTRITMQLSDPPHRRAVLGAAKAQPGDTQPAAGQGRRLALIAPARDAISVLQAGTKERPLAEHTG